MYHPSTHNAHVARKRGGQARPLRRAFTIVELLVAISIIAVLVGLLLPAVGRARDQARLTISRSNLRDLSAAHHAYAAEWNDRQFTLINGNIAAYGTSPNVAFAEYQRAHGDLAHPPIRLGWGYGPTGYGSWVYPLTPEYWPNYSLAQPIVFNATDSFGSFRLYNVRQFNQYVSGKFYDKVFYAPKDEVVLDAIGDCIDDPGEFSFEADVLDGGHDIPAWSSYCMSPAAMFNPAVMRHDDDQDPAANGWKNPWHMKGGFRSPGLSQALYPDLKSQMIEHHWLQNRQGTECNPLMDPGTYDGCEPFYFNHSRQSNPVAMFYDGHVALVGVEQAITDDAAMRAQTNNEGWGLWSQDTPFGFDGYLSNYGYEVQHDMNQVTTSFHILTTDGIRGRDISAQAD